MGMLKDCNTKEFKTNCSRYTGRNEEIGRPRNRWKDKVKEGFNVMGIIVRQWPEKVWNGESSYGKPRSTTACSL